MNARRVALGLAPARHDVAVAAYVLRGLGLRFDAALEIARRRLPDLPTAAAPSPALRVRRDKPKR